MTNSSTVGQGRWHFWQPFVLITAILTVIGLVTLALDDRQTFQVITEMMIRLVVVVGLYIFIGNSGVLSFGHIGFMAIGAYASAWFVCCTLPMVKPLYLPGLPDFLKQTSYPFSVGMLSAVTLSGAAALVVGAALMRLSGIAASIATFAFLGIIASVYGNWDSVTGGASSVSNIPADVDVTLATAFAIGAVLLAFLHQTSRLGLMLRATRDDPVAASSSGISAYRMRLVAFVLSGICVGAGGALYAGFLGILTVDMFYLSITFLTLAMLIVGGVGSLSGAVIGVLFVTAIIEFFRYLERGVVLGDTPVLQLPQGIQEIVLGIVMIVVLILRPAGLLNGKELSLGRRLSK